MLNNSLSSIKNESFVKSSNGRDENLALIEIATLGLIFVLIIFGNLCVLIALGMRQFKMTRMYYFLLHLCISDLITGLWTVLPQLLWDITYRFNGNNLLCKLVKFMQIFGPYLSSYVLAMTAIDRYQAICFPLSNCTWTPRRSQLMILVAWIVSIVCAAPQVIIFSYQVVPNETNVYDCWGTFPEHWGEQAYVTWYAISVFFIPLIIITYAYVFICREVWRNAFDKKRANQTANSEINMIDFRNNTRTTNTTNTNNNTNIMNTMNTNNTTNFSNQNINATNTTNTTKTTNTSNKNTKKTPNKNTKSNLSKAKSKQNSANNLAQQQHYTFNTTITTTTTTIITTSTNSNAGCCSSSNLSTANKRSSLSTRTTTSCRANEMNPRTHSIYRISRAKIKTVKVTVVVVICYIVCSSPFICVQLWASWYPKANETSFWKGPLITILMLLSSLNSCVNPWIYLFFNQNLLKSLAIFCQCFYRNRNSVNRTQSSIRKNNRKSYKNTSFRLMNNTNSDTRFDSEVVHDNN